MFYDRKIKYLDYFEDGERVKGGGFVKLEVRDRSLRMEIMVSGLNVNDTFIREIVLCGARQENILGRIEITKGKGQYQMQCHDLTDIGGTGIGYGELQGIRISLGSSRTLSCSWQQGASTERGEVTAIQKAVETTAGRGKSDIAVREESISSGKGDFATTIDRERMSSGKGDFATTIDRERMSSEKSDFATTADRERMSSGKDNSVTTADKEGISSAKWEEISIEKAAESTDKGKRQDIISQNSSENRVERQAVTQNVSKNGQEMQASTQKVSPNEAEGQSGEQSLPRSKWGEDATLWKSSGASNGKQTKRPKSGGTNQEKKQKTIFGEGGIRKENEEVSDGLQERRMQPEAEKELKKTSSANQAETTKKTIRLLEDKWLQLCAIYPHIHPFRDKREYLSIGPADFVLFPSASYKMVNNSFLLHGYYNYNHLILTRIEHKGEPRYYIGVPGNFFEKEKQVAIMFGFESFECEEEPAQTGDFGYYMMRTEL